MDNNFICLKEQSRSIQSFHSKGNKTVRHCSILLIVKISIIVLVIYIVAKFGQYCYMYTNWVTCVKKRKIIARLNISRAIILYLMVPFCSVINSSKILWPDTLWQSLLKIVNARVWRTDDRHPTISKAWYLAHGELIKQENIFN